MNQEKEWQCDFCHKEKDTLYFKGKKQICEECRRKVRKDKGIPKYKQLQHSYK